MRLDSTSKIFYSVNIIYLNANFIKSITYDTYNYMYKIPLKTISATVPDIDYQPFAPFKKNDTDICLNMNCYVEQKYKELN